LTQKIHRAEQSSEVQFNQKQTEAHRSAQKRKLALEAGGTDHKSTEKAVDQHKKQ
jgi:hypothetical protein